MAAAAAPLHSRLGGLAIGGGLSSSTGVRAAWGGAAIPGVPPGACAAPRAPPPSQHWPAQPAAAVPAFPAAPQCMPMAPPPPALPAFLTRQKAPLANGSGSGSTGAPQEPASQPDVPCSEPSLAGDPAAAAAPQQATADSKALSRDASAAALAAAIEDAEEGEEEEGPPPALHEPAAWQAPAVRQQAAAAAARMPAPSAAAADARPVPALPANSDTPAELRAIRAAADRIAASARLLWEADRSSAEQLAGLGLAAEVGSCRAALAGDALETRMAAAAAGLRGWLAHAGAL